jgi:hypothetical protein
MHVSGGRLVLAAASSVVVLRGLGGAREVKEADAETDAVQQVRLTSGKSLKVKKHAKTRKSSSHC